MRKLFALAGAAITLSLLGQPAQAEHKWNLKEGAPDLKSAGQLAFGPDGILIVGDAKGGAVFAIDTQDAKPNDASTFPAIEKFHDKLAAALGVDIVTINDLAVNPLSGKVYLSVAKGEAQTPALARIDVTGAISAVALDKVPFLKATLDNLPDDQVTGQGPRARNRRNEAISDLAYVEGKVLIAGVTKDPAPSAVRELAFPFAADDTGINVEIYHAAHGRVEDNATIRTFVAFTINGEPSLLAGFTCTPLVRFPLPGADNAGKKVRGTTVAELGNRNQPLDMIAYEKDGKKFLLMSNSARGVMKITTDDIGRSEGLTAPVTGGGTAGQSFETIKELEGTTQLDRWNDKLAVVVVKEGDALTLKSVQLP